MAQTGKPDAPVVRGTGVVLRDPLPWKDAVQIVETAEDTGYRAVFVPEISAREAFATLAGFAPVTARIRLGTGVVTMWSRSPQTTAMAAATLQVLSEGRFVLGVGSGTSSGAGPGVAPLDRLRRYIQVVRRLLAGDPVGPDDALGTDAFQLGMDVEPEPPPIWLGALGDRMVRLAGEIADGTVLNWCTPERVARGRETFRAAAERAGRDPDGATVAVYVRACLNVEEAVALGVLREAAGQYATLPAYLRQMEAMGLGDEGAIAAKAFQAGRSEDVPASLVRALTVMGGRPEALERFQAYRDAGADLVLCYPVPALDPLSSILGTLMAAAPSTAVER